jgi:iron(III) transport system ATP-binding protein
MLFQDYALFPHLNVEANVGFGLHGQPAAARENRISEVLKLVGLSDTRARFPHELSGGQQQRVALARALAPRPRLLLLDEPFSSLDVDLRERLAHEIRNILKLAGTTALMVTHDQLEAFAVGDAIGVMHEGALLQWGSAYELYHQPATRFVADFIGHGVFINAEVLADDPAHASGASHQRIESALGPLDGLSAGAADGLPLGAVDVLVRADDIVHDDDSAIVAQILRKTFRGSEFLYTLKLKSGEEVVVHVPSHHDHAVSEWIGIRVEMNHLVAFPQVI